MLEIKYELCKEYSGELLLNISLCVILSCNFVNLGTKCKNIILMCVFIERSKEPEVPHQSIAQLNVLFKPIILIYCPQIHIYNTEFTEGYTVKAAV